MSYGQFTIAIDNQGRGPFKVEYQPTKKPHPMFHGDTGSLESWIIEGPAHVAQHFYDERVAIGFCAVLNALHNQKSIAEL